MRKSYNNRQPKISMQLSLYNRQVLGKYTSHSQIARVLTENWFKEEMYCPCCLSTNIFPFENNYKGIDFYCKNCSNLFQAKSSKKEFTNRIADGEYNTMVKIIRNDTTPNFLCMHYSANDWFIKNLFIIPRFFFSISSIEKRNPLSASARRAGWTGCNILLNKIPESGRVQIIKNEKVIDKTLVLKNYNKLSFLKSKKPNLRGWTLDVLNCVESLDKEQFTLSEMYSFEKQLHLLHPENRYVKEKIRQQLQILRNNYLIQFKSAGLYKRIRNN